MSGEGRRAQRPGLRARINGYAAGRAAVARQGVEAYSEKMFEVADTPVGTRKRSLIAIIMGFSLVAAMYSLVAANVMAVNFTTGNNKFKVYSNYLESQKAAGFLSPSNRQNGTQVGVAELGIVTAKLSGLCAIASESLPLLGTVSLKVTAGDEVPDTYSGTGVPSGVTVDASGALSGASSTNAIAANNLFMNADMLSGYGNQISGLNLGQSAGSVAGSAGLTWPTDDGGASPQSQGTVGNFGLFAEKLNMGGLAGESYGLNLAGAITLPKLKITVEPGSLGQANCS